MRTRLAFVLLLLVPRPAVAAADLVLRGGAVYTMDAARSWADAVAIGGGRILYVGDDAGASRLAGRRTRVIDLAGRMVLPGFHDSHVHPVAGGIELSQCHVNELQTAAAILDAVRGCARGVPDGAWIVGGGWQLPIFPGGSPRREDLDAVVPDHPVHLSAADGHSAWLNSRALAVAGITSRTPDPPGGRIERDPATGEPTGTLRESAMDLLEPYLPRPGPAEHLAGLRRALEMAARLGITSLQEASADEMTLQAYASLDRRGELTARVSAAMTLDHVKGEAGIPGLLRMRAAYRGRRLKADAVKIFADGVIESRTAALLEPYLDRPADRGTPALEPSLMTRLATRLDREGFQIHVHAIGDGAIRMTLDAFQAAIAANGRRDRRHHLAHIQLIDPADIPRFRELGAAANFQPLWAWADPYITELTEPALGPARSRWLYPISSVMRAGAMVAGGSDWSVSSMNPLEAIQVAVTRCDPERPVCPGWIPEERADLAGMLAAYTINGAWLAHGEKSTGSIEPGKMADLVVLDRNLFAVAPAGIATAKVLLTLVEGVEVFRDAAFGEPPAAAR